MSHNINYFTYKENCNKKQVQRDINNLVAHEDWEEGASGLNYPIRWFENAGVCESYEKAKEFIRAHDDGNYDSLAVRYKAVENGVLEKDKKRQEIVEKLTRAQSIVFSLDNAFHFADVKSEMIGCKNCGSKIASRYMRTRNNCPVCLADMRPQTTLDRIKSAREKSKEYDKQLRARDDELTKKSSKIQWLVKIEYHT